MADARVARDQPPQNGTHPNRNGGASRYLPGLDGLRALAVLAVVLYHAPLDGLVPGGFLGVEVFFVISGFIITRGLLTERADSSRINLKSFWFRRARRLLPAVAVLLVAVLAYTEIWDRNELAGLREDLLAAITYVTNWQLIFSDVSYFEAFGRPPLLQHLWSLAIEEQFYLAWPLLMSLGLTLFRPRNFALLIVAGALASTLAMLLLYEPGSDPSRLYYGTDTRASGLLLGAAFAFLVRSGVGLPGTLTRDLAAVVSVAALGACFLAVTDDGAFLYRGGFLAVDLVTLALIAAVIHPSTVAARAFSIAPLQWVGLRSYAIYLWHWPVIQLMRPDVDISLDGVDLFALQLVIILALSDLSYRFVERPVRNGALGRGWEWFNGQRTAPLGQRAFLGITTLAAGGSLLALASVAISADPPAAPDYFELESIRINSPAQTPAPTAQASAVPGTATTPAQPAVATPVPATPTPKPLPKVTAIGDSVMLGAAYALADAIPTIDLDARVTRPPEEALEILRAHLEAGTLGEVLLIHIGNAVPLTAAHFDEFMALAGPDRHVIFFNIRAPRDYQASVNEVISSGAARYPNAVMVDWYAAAANSAMLTFDQLHVTDSGADLYAQLVRAHLP